MRQTHASLMKRTRSALVAVTTRDLVTSLCNLFIEVPPERHAEWKMQQRHDWPQQGQSFRQIAKRISATKFFSRRGNDPHLVHQLCKAQIWIQIGHTRIVKGEKSQSVLAVKSSKVVDLTSTEIALAIVGTSIGTLRKPTPILKHRT